MHMDRRQFVKNLGLGTASLSMGSLVTASSCAPSGDSSLKQNVKEGEDGQFLFIGDDIARVWEGAGISAESCIYVLGSSLWG